MKKSKMKKRLARQEATILKLQAEAVGHLVQLRFARVCMDFNMHPDDMHSMMTNMDSYLSLFPDTEAEPEPLTIAEVRRIHTEGGN